MSFLNEKAGKCTCFAFENKYWFGVRKVLKHKKGNQKCKLKKDRQYNGQKKKYKQTNNDL